MHVIYLHGFASSPASTKAAFFVERLRPHGIEVRCPDLNEPDFETLTVSRMIGQVDALVATLAPGPVALIGSSLGGFAAYHLAARHARRGLRSRHASHPIDRLVLLAPALDFGRSGFGTLDEAGLERWRVTDRFDVMHYAWNRVMPVRYALYEDAQAYDSFTGDARIPTLIFHGRLDSVVDPDMVLRFASDRPSVSLRMVDDNHQLGGNLGRLWTEVAAFMGVCS